jgi:hypothetical protein
MHSMLNRLFTLLFRRIPRDPDPMPRMRWY